MTVFKKRIRRVAVKYIQVDRSWQRETITSHVNYIAASWDENAVGVIIVSERDDGTYWVLDGQHRVLAKRRTDTDYEFLCLCIQGASQEEEAYLFTLYNDRRKGVAHYDKYKANLLSGNPLHKKVEKVLRGHQLKAARSPGRQEVAAISTILTIVNKYGADTLDTALSVAEEAWGRDSQTWRGTVLGTIGDLLGRYQADADQLVYAFKMKAPTAWLSLAGQGGSARVEMMKHVVGEYNRGKRGKARIKLPGN